MISNFRGGATTTRGEQKKKKSWNETLAIFQVRGDLRTLTVRRSWREASFRHREIVTSLTAPLFPRKLSDVQLRPRNTWNKTRSLSKSWKFILESKPYFLHFFSLAHVSFRNEAKLLKVMDNEAFSSSFFLWEGEAPIWTWSVVEWKSAFDIRLHLSVVMEQMQRKTSNIRPPSSTHILAKVNF